MSDDQRRAREALDYLFRAKADPVPDESDQPDGVKARRRRRIVRAGPTPEPTPEPTPAPVRVEPATAAPANSLPTRALKAALGPRRSRPAPVAVVVARPQAQPQPRSGVAWQAEVRLADGRDLAVVVVADNLADAGRRAMTAAAETSRWHAPGMSWKLAALRRMPTLL